MSDVKRMLEALGIESNESKIARLTAALAAAEAAREEAQRKRNALSANVEIVRGIVAEMHSDATKPKGGQSVGMRRMPVPLSIILELERALGPEQGTYTAGAFTDLYARAETAESRLAEVERERDAEHKAYLDLADAVCRSSAGPEDACRQARATRNALAAALRSAEQAQQRVKALEGALLAAAKSLEWISNRKRAEEEPMLTVIMDVRSYANSRAMVARALLSAAPGEESAPPPTKKEGP